MGLMDTVRSILGVSAERDATRDADPEALFGMSTVAVGLGLVLLLVVVVSRRYAQ